jgi:hypothetical protein
MKRLIQIRINMMRIRNTTFSAYELLGGKVLFPEIYCRLQNSYIIFVLPYRPVATRSALNIDADILFLQLDITRKQQSTIPAVLKILVMIFPKSTKTGLTKYS